MKLGIHKKTNEKVAVKIIRKAHMEPKDLKLIRTEIDIMKLCKHENVVRLFDLYENSDFIYIILELMKGGSLASYLHKKEFNFFENEIKSITHQLVNALTYLHSFGIMHRDIKAENILLSKEDSVKFIKISDFGLSKLITNEEKCVEGYGTLFYVAPEILVKQPYDKKIDIWSLGVLVYYIISGNYPFNDSSNINKDISKRIVFDKLSFKGTRFSYVSDSLKDFIMTCLQKDPLKRPSINDLSTHVFLNS